MKISGIANPLTDVSLQLLKQVGVDDLVYYDMSGMPTELDELAAAKKQVENAGLRLAAVEAGPRIDRIVLGKPGRDQQIEEYKRGLIHMGKLGIEVLCYNFMPQVSTDAMVVRTATSFPERGGAETSQFRLSEVKDDTVPHSEGATTDEQMWENLEHFLKQVIPVAEAAGVKLAMHPDDPPLSPLCGLARILRGVQHFDRLLALSDSPAHGITLCQGCFKEMGCDIPEVIRHFSDRIHFVHFRDVSGAPEDFHETFPDNGPTDMVEVFRTYAEIGYDGLVRVDHVPLLVTEGGNYDGYGMQGHVFAIGYLKGLMEPFFGKTSS